MSVIDSTQLASAEAEALQRTLNQVKSLTREHKPEGFDFVKYELLVENSGAQDTISFEDDRSDRAQKLVQLVNTMAANKKM